MNPRSYLFASADRPQRFAKALASGVDAVIVDLEDAVAPANKDAARDALARWLVPTRNDATVVVRVNGADSPWFDADHALVARSPGVVEVMLHIARLYRPPHIDPSAADLSMGGVIGAINRDTLAQFGAHRARRGDTLDDLRRRLSRPSLTPSPRPPSGP